MRSVSLPLNIASDKSLDQEGYLQVKLDSKTQGLIPIKKAKEAVIVSCEKITIMPNMPQWVIGLFNQRNRVFWVIDLPHLLQLSSVKIKPGGYSIVMIQVGSIPLGLLVEEIQGVIRFSEDKIQSLVGTYASGLTPYVKGCVFQPPNEILLVLEPQAIIQVERQMMFPL